MIHRLMIIDISLHISLLLANWHYFSVFLSVRPGRLNLPWRTMHTVQKLFKIAQSNFKYEFRGQIEVILIHYFWPPEVKLTSEANFYYPIKLWTKLLCNPTQMSQISQNSKYFPITSISPLLWSHCRPCLIINLSLKSLND